MVVLDLLIFSCNVIDDISCLTTKKIITNKVAFPTCNVNISQILISTYSWVSLVEFSDSTMPRASLNEGIVTLPMTSLMISKEIISYETYENTTIERFHDSFRTSHFFRHIVIGETCKLVTLLFIKPLNKMKILTGFSLAIIFFDSN